MSRKTTLLKLESTNGNYRVFSRKSYRLNRINLQISSIGRWWKLRVIFGVNSFKIMPMKYPSILRNSWRLSQKSGWKVWKVRENNTRSWGKESWCWSRRNNNWWKKNWGWSRRKESWRNGSWGNGSWSSKTSLIPKKVKLKVVSASVVKNPGTWVSTAHKGTNAIIAMNMDIIKLIAPT